MCKIVFLIVLLQLFISCSNRIGDFTVISTRNSNIKNWKRAPERVEGSSCSYWILFFKVKSWDIKDAIEDAVDSYNKQKKTNANYESLLDPKLTASWFTILLLTRSCILAEGTPSDSWYETIEREDQIKKGN